MLRRSQSPRSTATREPRSRRGVIAILAALLLVVLFGFVAFGVDTGRMALTKTQLQNGVDAAALAASQEISSEVSRASEEQDDVDVNETVLQSARQVAVEVAAANGIYIDGDRDVRFGNRSYDSATDTWPIQWDQDPYNVVQVVARRDNPDTTQPDGRQRLSFGWAVGMDSVEMSGKGTAFVEARDMVLVLDFSGSMSYDSQLQAYNSLGRTAVEQNMEDIWQALGPPPCGSLPFEPQYLTVEGEDPYDSSQPKIHVTFQGGDSILVDSTKDLSDVILLFTDGGYYWFDDLDQGGNGTFSYSNKEIGGCYVKCGDNHTGDGSGYGERFDDDVSEVRKAFGLDDVDYPYNSGSWNSVINHCRNDSQVRNKGYEKMYGGLLMVEYLLADRPRSHQTYDLYKTPHYPFHAVKNGTSLFLDFLSDIDFGDEIGLVTYDQNARVETGLNESDSSVDLYGNLITSDYDAIDEIQRHKQAGHYDIYTGIGAGLQSSRWLLENHKRAGARPTIILMTDGNANRSPGGWSLPGDWSWADHTDFDGDGDADYSSGNRHKQYAIYQASLAVEEGAKIHTLTVGAGADRSLMEAIAFMGSGEYIDVPGGNTVAEMESQMVTAFGKIAAKIPPPKLITE